MHVVIFEGNRWPNFAPLTLSRPVFMLRSGLSTLLDQQIRRLRPTRLTLWVRSTLADYCRTHVAPTLPVPTQVNVPLDDEPALLSSGRAVHLENFDYPSEPSVVLDDGDVVRTAFVHSLGLRPEDCLLRTDNWLKLMDLPRVTAGQARLPTYAWDLSQWNEEAIVADAISMHRPAGNHPAGPYHLVAAEDVHLGDGVAVGPGVVLDASRGPVVVDAGATVGANSVLEGPCHVGPYTTVRPLTYIRGGTSIGPGCKLGGEISNSIILGNSNKFHDGFLGDSYLGEWVNLGAGTTTSNLKNTYGTVKMRIGPMEVETERRFLGSVIGDHSKTAIGTRLMTGTYVGYCCLLAASTLPPRYIPSFTYWTDKGPERFRLEKAKEVMQQVFGRRGRAWTPEDEAMLNYAADTAKQVERM